MFAYGEVGWPPDITASWTVWANSAWNALSAKELSASCSTFNTLINLEGTYVLSEPKWTNAVDSTRDLKNTNAFCVLFFPLLTTSKGTRE